ncbi:MAG: YezD family protein [Spirochaetes bacterium]|nr:YezD family protein [Spirochaetota bacterium]
MNRKKAEAIVLRMIEFAEGIRYGNVAVEVKMHDGRVVQIKAPPLQGVV